MFYPFDFLGLTLPVILFVVIFVKISNLKKRVKQLESLSNSNSPSSVPTPTAPTSLVQPQVVPNSVPTEITPESSGQFVAWLKDDWLLKLGGLLLLIAFGWFTTYAFVNNWIGPVGRISLGLLAGVLVLALGTWRVRKYLNQGGIFLVLGSTIILLTVFAAQEYYKMFNPVLALLIMFLSAAYIALISVKYNSFAVALSGFVLSVLAPILTGGGDNMLGLFSYLLVIVLGVIWIVSVRKNWGSLVFASLVSVFLYSLPTITMHRQTDQYLLNFAYVFALVFFVSSIFSILKSREGDLRSFLWTAVFNALFLILWITSFVSNEWQSLVIVVWMLIFAVGAFILFLQTKIHRVFYVYAGVAVAFLATATAIELDGAALTLAFIIESALIPILIYPITKSLKATSTSTVLLIAPILLSFENLSEYLYSRGQLVFDENFFVLLLLSIALLVVGSTLKNIKKTDQSVSTNSDIVISIIGSVYVYVLLWGMIHNAMGRDEAAATTVSLIVFTIIGLVKYFYGMLLGSKVLRNYGGILLGLVVARLLLIDVWSMDMAPRIVVFFLIGVLLISTAFISRKIKSNITTN